MYRTKTNLDANHIAIRDHLKANGVWCWDCAASGGGLPDLIVHYRETAFLEIKVEKKAQIYRTQLVFIAFTKAMVGFAQNEAEALLFAKEPAAHCLTQAQKNKIGAHIFATEPKKQRFEFRQIQELIGGQI